MATPKQLQDYHQIIKPKDLTAGFQVSSVVKTAPHAKESIHDIAMNMIVNSDRTGAFLFQEIVSGIKNFITNGEADASIHNVLQVYSDVTPPDGAEYGDKANGYASISTVMGEQQENGSKVGVIFSNSPKVSLNLRHMNHVTTFMSAIPSIEMSRAVPFIDVNFQFKSDNDNGALTKDDRHRIPSLLRFLEGASPAKGASKAIAQSYDRTDEATNSKISEIDMGIFMAPQTLVNPDLKYNAAGGTDNVIAAEIGDKFRPLASLINVTIDVVASPSYTVAYKWMKMELILHDRTRMSELANLIRPAVYTGTSVVVKYGWSHPDDPQTNAYAELINQMRVEERYAIKNASYSFDDVGQVKINLELSMLGENQLWLSRVTEDKTFRNLQTKFEEVRERIFSLIQDLGLPVEGGTRAHQIMNFIDNSANSDIPDEEITKTIAKFTSSIKNSNKGEKAKLAEELSNLLEGKIKDPDKNVKGLKEKLKNTTFSQFEKKFAALRDNPDPFLPDPDKSTILYAKSLKSKITTNPQTKKKSYGVASLAKVMTLYILQPLRQSGKFDEIQLICYPFNDYCGMAGGSNIGSFPIDIGIFKKVMEDQVQKKGLRDLTTAAFGKLLNDAFIADPSALAYGMSTFYVARKDSELPKPVQGQDLEKEQDILLGKTAGGGVWKNPTVEFYIECLTKNEPPSATRNVDAKTRTGSILRIHVYDKQSTPWDGFMKLKSSLSRIRSSTVPADKKKTGNKPADLEDPKAQVQKAVNDLKEVLGLGGAEIDIENAQFSKNFNVGKIKKLVSSFVPTLTYGTNNTGILKANLQSIQDPRLSTVNQVRQNSTSTTQPNGAGVAGMPLRVIPGQVQISMIGCPLMSINQQFFIDFGTNTDLDNFYALTGLSHHISAGKFETSAKFIWSDAYGSYENVSTQLKQLSELIKKASE